MAKVRREERQRKPKPATITSESKALWGPEYLPSPTLDVAGLSKLELEQILAPSGRSADLTGRLGPAETLEKQSRYERRLRGQLKRTAGRLLNAAQSISALGGVRDSNPFKRWVHGHGPAGRNIWAHAVEDTQPKPPSFAEPILALEIKYLERRARQLMAEARSLAGKGGRPKKMVYAEACRFLLRASLSFREIAVQLMRFGLDDGPIEKATGRVRLCVDRLPKEKGSLLEKMMKLEEPSRKESEASRLPPRIGGPRCLR